MDFLFAVAILIGDFCRTSSFIDVPCPPRFKQGMFAISILPSFASRTTTGFPRIFNVNFKYGIGAKAEVAATVYSTTSYAASFSYLLVSETKSTPGLFGGVDDLTYTSEVSPTGGTGTGFPDDSAYVYWGGRNPEVFSLYLAGYKKVKPFNFVLGLGRGRFVGYGPRSRCFNTDYYFRQVGKDNEKNPSIFAIGLFMGASINITPYFILMGEFDGRDGNIGLRYRHKYFDVNVAGSKLEQTGMASSYSSRYSFGLEVNNGFLQAQPKTGILACAVVDAQAKTPIPDIIVAISETGKRYHSAMNYFELTLPKGKYTLKVEKKDYETQVKTVEVSGKVKNKIEFMLVKSAGTMKKEAESLTRQARQKQIQELLRNGLDYISKDSLLAAKNTFTRILQIDSTHAEAKSSLVFVNNRIQDIIAMSTRQAEVYRQQRNNAQSLSLYQKVLQFDPANQAALKAVADLSSKTTVVEKPTPSLKKPTAAEIDALYKKGVSLFIQKNYDEALKIFKKVLTFEPNHAGANNYLKKTEARLKTLRGD